MRRLGTRRTLVLAAALAVIANPRAARAAIGDTAADQVFGQSDFSTSTLGAGRAGRAAVSARHSRPHEKG
jgi:hypothetical protein